MIITECIIAIMYVALLGCVLYCINKIQMDKLKRDIKPINKVHFYVARDMDGILWFYISKPHREDSFFQPSDNGHMVAS